MNIVVGIGEYAISNNSEDVIRALALGSCVALTIYSPAKKVLGMAHIALPDSETFAEESTRKPWHFADMAVPLLLRTMQNNYGCHRDELSIGIYGGADSAHQDDMFKIGKRNIKAVKKHLALHNVTCVDEHTGGNFSRTVEADVANGMVKISATQFDF
jgi:chemotaxis protein CheD